MGTTVSRFENLHCGEDHGYAGCPKNHTVSAEWHRSSDYCTITVDDKPSLTMPLDLFMDLRRAMMAVDA